MEAKEENIPEEEQQLQEKTIPVFTVLKNGAILKNIFVVNSLYFSSPEQNDSTVCDDNEVEEILVVGRHPDCDILLTHPSISRFHLEIRSIASRQKLFVTDLSSVHGTWVTDRRVEPHACVEVKEGDTIRIGGSTRIYRLHWIPLSRAYDIDNPFVSPFDASTVMEQEEENRMLDAENLEVVHQSPENVASGDDRDLHLDVTSEGTGSSVPSEDDTYDMTRETSLPLASPSVLTLASDSIKKQKLRFSEDLKTSTEWDLDVEEAAAEKPSSSSAETDICDVRGDGGLHLNVMSERLELEVLNEDEVLYPAESETLALPLSTDSIETEKLQLTENIQASPELVVNLLEANAENLRSGCSPSKGQIDGCLEASDCSAGKSVAELEILSHHREVSRETDFLTEQVMEASVEPLPKAEIRGHEASCSSTFELDMEVEIVSVSGEVSAHTDFVTKQVMEASAGPLTKSDFWSHEDNVHIEIWNEMNPAEDQNQKKGMTRETEILFDEGRSSCLSEDLKQNDTQSFLLTPDQKPKTELSTGSGRSEKYYSLSEIEGKENAHKWCPISSPLAAETFEVTKTVEEPETPSDDDESQENHTPQTHTIREDESSAMDSPRRSPVSSSTCNIWSRRGKATSVLQIRTNKSEGKQKQNGNQPKDQLHRKQALGDKSIHHSAEQLEPEIFTPDKENLTPSSHMLKRLQDIGDLKNSKSSSKLSGKSGTLKIHSSIAIVSPGVFTEPEIFTPDKENLTPNSHMLKRFREFGEIKETKGSSSKATRKPFFDTHVEENVMAKQKPNLHCMSNKSKVKHEPVEPKKKAERAPFQPLLENPLSRSLSYTEASCTASARNNISRGIQSTTSKMKWTIVLDTSSLLDNDSRKPLCLLQGIKGTHMIVPRTVLRELNEVKRSRSLLFRRRAETASSALDWIEDCKVNKKWWIQIQSPSEETKATAPTPPVTPLSNGSAAFPFSFHWSNNAPEMESPTSEDQILECALLYRNRNIDEKLILLSNDETLKIKAMAEGVICETPHEFYGSLANPFSERFMWTESTARGRTWSHFDDVVLRERYDNRACRKKPTYKGGSGAAAKGLKLILHHNSHYGHTH